MSVWKRHMGRILISYKLIFIDAVYYERFSVFSLTGIEFSSLALKSFEIEQITISMIGE